MGFVFILFIFIFPVLSQLTKSAYSLTPPDIVIIVDASGSMWGRLYGREVKIDVVKEALKKLISSFPEDHRIALITFGRKSKRDPEDVEVLYPLSKPDKKKLIELIDMIQPLGMTPLAKAIDVAFKHLLEHKSKYADIILITDDADTTGKNPVLEAKTVTFSQPDYHIHVIGLALDRQEISQLRGIADYGNGMFLQVTSANMFKRALTQVITSIIKKAPEEYLEPPQTTLKPAKEKTVPQTPEESSPSKGVRKIKIVVNLLKNGRVKLDGPPAILQSVVSWRLISIDGEKTYQTTSNTLDNIIPGTYKILLKVRGIPSEITLPQEIEVKPTEVTRVRLDSGVSFTAPEGLDSSIIDYTIIESDTGKQICTVRENLWGIKYFLPGNYKLIVSVKGFDRPVFLKEPFTVRNGEITSVILNSGIDIKPFSPAKETITRWALREWDSDNVIANVTGNMWGKKFVPPGMYRITLFNEGTDRDVAIVSPIIVTKGKVLSLNIDSFISLQAVKELLTSIASWSIKDTASGKLIFSTSDIEGKYKYVPPGEYNIYVKNNGGSEDINAGKYTVRPGEKIRVYLRSGIRLIPSETVRDRITSWYVYRIDDNIKVEAIWSNLWNTKFLPPGSYRISVLDKITGSEITVVSEVQITYDTIVEVEIK